MRKFVKYFLALSLVIACIVCFTACGEKQSELTSITATIDDNYSVYLLDDIDTSKITVKAKYSDDKEETIQASDYEIGDFDSTISGEQELKITYKDKTTTLKINVSDQNKRKEEGIKPTFIRDGKIPYWKVKVSKTGEWKYFSDENLKNEVSEEELVIPKYVVKSTAVTKVPTTQDLGIVSITTTTNENIKLYIPNLNADSLWGYTKISKATWTENNKYAYILDLDKLKNDWWESYNYERKSDEYNITNQVDIVKPYLETLVIDTEEIAPAVSTKFVIEKVGTTKLTDEYVSRVVVRGKLLYGKLDYSMRSNYLSIYFKGEDIPFTERFVFNSINFDEKTKEYEIVTNFFTASNDIVLGTEGIHCSYNKNGSLNDLLIKPGDIVVSNQRKTYDIQINSINAGEEISVGDVLCIGDEPCKILSIRDITNQKDLDKLTSVDSVVYVEVEILHNLGLDMWLFDSMSIRSGKEITISKYEEGSYDFIDKEIALGQVNSVISTVKADITVSGANEIVEGTTIDDLMPGELNIAKVTHLYEANKIGNAKVISVPNAKNSDDVYKDVILKIYTTSQASETPEVSNNYFSRECIDYLNGCLSVGETIKVYSSDKSIVYTITITEYNFD